jgi:putative FmdB family regulatory protein
VTPERRRRDRPSSEGRTVPTYQYACTECDHAFEQVQSFSDDALTECPQCQGRLRKVFNAVGVVFKGSGFYRTDSRADSKSGGKDASTSSPAVSSGGSEKKAESSAKPAEPKPAAAASSSSSSTSSAPSSS